MHIKMTLELIGKLVLETVSIGQILTNISVFLLVDDKYISEIFVYLSMLIHINDIELQTNLPMKFRSLKLICQ